MDRIKPDILAEIYLYPTEEGGRKGPTPPTFYGCPLYINENYYSFRIFLNGSVAPGEKAIGPVKFLIPEMVIPKIKVGNTYKMWESGFKGELKVLEVYYQVSDNEVSK